ncbi:MAG: GTPase [Bdellovibrionales bacterium]|nr:GTPase [Bdellovibrionales bacterium]MBT3526477.1 GTPase [Bdellovibrionales bacterium]MBT7765928.1 GTPase [Bdellovibrionales bacterium]
MTRKRVIIMGAAGRDFHNFNTTFRDSDEYQVVAFTATQIPDIEGKVYPTELAGKRYPAGIPIRPESELFDIIAKEKVETVVFSYSDVTHEYVMHKASQIITAGADFMLLGSNKTELPSTKPVISVCATRTGCGKSQTTRRITEILQSMGKKVVAVRHPMPYGDLSKQVVQRFATLEDLKRHDCTIEEMEEYEPYINMGSVIFAGIDYERILRDAEKEADVIIWDGGNNDTPFFKSDLRIVVADPHRVGHELAYHPGEANIFDADVVVINKVDTADFENILELRDNISTNNPDALIIEAASPLTVENFEKIAGKRVLAVEDGPTLTHGEMQYGAAVVAAQRFGASELVDPREWAVGKIEETFAKYPYIGTLLPAMGYGTEQVKDLENTINSTDCDLVLIGTPIDLNRVIKIDKPTLRIGYDLQEIGTPNLETVLRNKFL